MSQPAMLTRRGTVCGAAGRLVVTVADDRCAHCDGRCGLRLGGTPRLPLEGEMAPGTVVEVSVAARAIAWRSLAVFGTPVAAAVAAMAGVELGGGSDWIVVVALLGGVAATLVVRLASSRRTQQPAWRIVELGSEAGSDQRPPSCR